MPGTHPFGGSPYGGAYGVDEGYMPRWLGRKDRRMEDAAAILGEGGVLRIGLTEGNLSIMEEVTSYGMEVMVMVAWSGAYTETDWTALIALLTTLKTKMDSGSIAVRGFVFGNEVETVSETVEDVYDDAYKYITDINTFIFRLHQHGISALTYYVYGPSIAMSNSSGAHNDISREWINAMFVGSGGHDPLWNGGSMNIYGIDLHSYTWEPHITSGANQHALYWAIETAKAAPYTPMNFDKVHFMLGETGCPWGATYGVGTTIEYTSEPGQANIGLGNILQAMGNGVELSLWASFPWDEIWDGTDPYTLHNNTGMVVGPHSVAECWNLAGGWRKSAYQYQYLNNLWRNLGVAPSGTVVADTEYYTLVSFDCADEKTMYVMVQKVETKPAPDPVVIDLTSKSGYIVCDTEDMTVVYHAKQSNSLSISSSSIPQIYVV